MPTFSSTKPSVCTQAIESRRYTGQDLAYLHFMRGTIHQQQAEHDRAIADYDAALRLSPEMFLARIYRFTAEYYRAAGRDIVNGLNASFHRRR